MRAHDPVMNDSLQVHVIRSDGVVVVDVAGELDAGTSGPVADAVEAATLYDAGVVVVDTSALTFVDSGGRRALAEACRRANAVFVPGRAVERFDRLLARALRTPGRRGRSSDHGAPTFETVVATGR
jgi:anti-anti-sigma factor